MSVGRVAFSKVDATAGVVAVSDWIASAGPCRLDPVGIEGTWPSTVGGGVIPVTDCAFASVTTADATAFLSGERARAWVGDGKVASSK